MSKFGADLETTDGVPIMMGKYGPAHAIKQYGGSYFLCRRQAALCRVCAEQGVPLYPPDPYEVRRAALRDNRFKRWEDSVRQNHALGDDEIWPADGLHIVAVDDETGDRTILVSFGDNEVATAAVQSLVDDHNEMAAIMKAAGVMA